MSSKEASRLVQISGNLFAENGIFETGNRIEKIHLRPKVVSDRDLAGARTIVRKGGKWFLQMYSGPDLPLQEVSRAPTGVWKGFYLLDAGESHPRALTAQGMRIGPRGLEDPKKGITLQPNTVYWMGASLHPSMIIVTKVTDDAIEYMDPYTKKKSKVQRWIGEDLIMQGSKRWLESYGKYQPESAKSIRSMLKGGPGKKVNLRDFDRLRVTVRANDPSKDLWREAEQYGNVAGIERDDGVMLYEIEGFRCKVDKIKKDNRFKVESEKKIASSGSVLAKLIQGLEGELKKKLIRYVGSGSKTNVRVENTGRHTVITLWMELDDDPRAVGEAGEIAKVMLGDNVHLESHRLVPNMWVATKKIAGKKELRSIKDKARSDKLKGKRDVEPKDKEKKGPKTQEQKKLDEEKRRRQVEKGKFGLPGAGRATVQPSKKQKEKSRKVKHKKKYSMQLVQEAQDLLNPSQKQAAAVNARHVATLLSLRKGDKVLVKAGGLPKPRVLTVLEGPTKHSNSKSIMVFVASGKTRPGHRRGGVLTYRPAVETEHGMYLPEELTYQPTLLQRVQHVTDLKKVSEAQAERYVMAALPNGTVEMFIEVLSSKLTQWDKRYNKDNPYALGHYLEAVGRVRDMMRSDLKKDDPEALAKLKRVIDRFLEPQFGPVKTTKKQIDKFLEKGTKPSLVRASDFGTKVAFKANNTQNVQIRDLASYAPRVQLSIKSSSLPPASHVKLAMRQISDAVNAQTKVVGVFNKMVTKFARENGIAVGRTLGLGEPWLTLDGGYVIVSSVAWNLKTKDGSTVEEFVEKLENFSRAMGMGFRTFQ